MNWASIALLSLIAVAVVAALWGVCRRRRADRRCGSCPVSSKCHKVRTPRSGKM